MSSEVSTVSGMIGLSILMGWLHGGCRRASSSSPNGSSEGLGLRAQAMSAHACGITPSQSAIGKTRTLRVTVEEGSGAIGYITLSPQGGFEPSTYVKCMGFKITERFGAHAPV
jgi:hypothetical protein